MIDGQEVVYERPTGTPRGILALFHGCQHSAIDFWSKQSTCATCIGERVVSMLKDLICASVMKIRLFMHAAGVIRRTARREAHSTVCSCETVCSHRFLIYGPGRKPLLGHGSTVNSHPRRPEGGVLHGLQLGHNEGCLCLLPIESVPAVTSC